MVWIFLSKDPGSEFPADSKIHSGNLKVWSGPLPDEALVSVQVIRNGEIVQAWDLRSKNARAWTGSFRISETSFAWYAIRVTSTCKNPGSLATWAQPVDIYEIAVANPVYFLPEWYHRPEPVKAKVRLHITDEYGNPLKATVSVVEYGKEISSQTADAKGTAMFEAPATAYLVIKAQGFADLKRDLYMDSPVYNYCKDFNDFFTPAGFNYLRELLVNLSFDMKLKKELSPP